MSITFNAERSEGEKGVSLAALRDFVNQAVSYASPTDDLTQVFPSVQVTLGGKPLIKKATVTLG